VTSRFAQTVPLGFQWPTVDPFLFCVHHVDHYPAGNGRFGPAASLEGRAIGSDFEPRDGWRMYHGSTVPGFPEHPHRGFETITFARQGFIDHSDSMGAAARFGRGDVQWMTAGRGVVHSEMFPLIDTVGTNTCELFQIWLNLPAADKMVEPHFTMLWADTIPVRQSADDAGRTSTVTVIAGDGAEIAAPTGAVAADAEALTLTAGAQGAEVLVLQGRPIGEPVVQYGPFVMNTRSEIEQAFADYRSTGFGGWPWDRPDPVHGEALDAAGGGVRFARHADGRLDVPAAVAP